MRSTVSFTLRSIHIAGNPRAAGRGNLHHGQPLQVIGMLLEKFLDRHQPLHDSLGVVHAIHAHDQGFTAQAELFQQFVVREGSGVFRSGLLPSNATLTG
jgi:hypothetical protein